MAQWSDHLTFHFSDHRDGVSTLVAIIPLTAVLPCGIYKSRGGIANGGLLSKVRCCRELCTYGRSTYLRPRWSTMERRQVRLPLLRFCVERLARSCIDGCRSC